MTSWWPGADAGHLLPLLFTPLAPKDYWAVLYTFRMVLYFLAADHATCLWAPSRHAQRCALVTQVSLRLAKFIIKINGHSHLTLSEACGR